MASLLAERGRRPPDPAGALLDAPHPPHPRADPGRAGPRRRLRRSPPPAPSSADRLAVDGIAALASVANWRFIASPPGRSAPPPPWPRPCASSGPWPCSARCCSWCRCCSCVRARPAAAGPANGWAPSWPRWWSSRPGSACVLHHSPARVLYGTDTRAAEVLVGCLLAIVIYDPRVTIRLAMRRPGARRHQRRRRGGRPRPGRACGSTVRPANKVRW